MLQPICPFPSCILVLWWWRKWISCAWWSLIWFLNLTWSWSLTCTWRCQNGGNFWSELLASDGEQRTGFCGDGVWARVRNLLRCCYWGLWGFHWGNGALYVFSWSGVAEVMICGQQGRGFSSRYLVWLGGSGRTYGNLPVTILFS